MKSRAARLALLILFVVALGVTAYLFRTSESLAHGEASAARAFGDAVRPAAEGVLTLRASQQAYVAAGQTGDFWAARVDAAFAALRDQLAALRASASTPQAQSEIDAAAGSLQDFARMDARAREYVRTNQKLLASDLIFSNGQELTDNISAAIGRARTAELAQRQLAAETFERRQVFALAAAGAASLLVVLLLFPLAEPTTPPGSTVPRPAATAAPFADLPQTDPADLMQTEAEGWSRPVSVEPAPGVAAETPASEPPPESAPAAAVAGVADHEPGAVVLPTAPVTDFASVASICTELARVLDTDALPPLLERAARALDASGIIVWIADPDGRELNAIMAQGYSPQLLSRLGAIPRDDQNATAAAFRTGLIQTVTANGRSNGAVAAPLVTAGGCVGVMAAEMLHGGEQQDTKLAAAAIVAAQLATLVGPPAQAHERVGAAG